MVWTKAEAVTSLAQINYFHERGSIPGSYYIYPAGAGQSSPYFANVFAIKQLPTGQLSAAPANLSVNFKIVFNLNDALGNSTASFARRSALSVQSMGIGFPEFVSTASGLVTSTFAGDNKTAFDVCPLEAQFTCPTPAYTNSVMTSCDGIPLAGMQITAWQRLPYNAVTLIPFSMDLNKSSDVRIEGAKLIVRVPAACHRDSGTMASETTEIRVRLGRQRRF